MAPKQTGRRSIIVTTAKNMSEDEQGKVHPDCRNASNPYHECSGYCFRVIAEAKKAKQSESDDDDEAPSLISDSSISVGKYRVKERISYILQTIFNIFGDIAASCKLESLSMQSYYLECVCFVVEELQSTSSIKQLTKSKVKEILAILKDVECAGIDISWLRNLLNQRMEEIEAAKANWRKQLQSQMEGLALKEKEVAEAKKQVAESKAHLKNLELKSFPCEF